MAHPQPSLYHSTPLHEPLLTRSISVHFTVVHPGTAVSEKMIVPDRTTHFTDALVAQLDERTVRRLESLAPWVQRDVIYSFVVKDGISIRNIDQYLYAVVGWYQHLAQSGLEPAESERRIALGRTGKRMKYHTCYSYGKHGACVYERDCCNVHIDGIYESD